jgi:hypothetical protein
MENEFAGGDMHLLGAPAKEFLPHPLKIVVVILD